MRVPLTEAEKLSVRVASAAVVLRPGVGLGLGIGDSPVGPGLMVELDRGNGGRVADRDPVELAVTFTGIAVVLWEGSPDSSGHSKRVPVWSGSLELAGAVVLAGQGKAVPVGSEGRDVVRSVKFTDTV